MQVTSEVNDERRSDTTWSTLEYASRLDWPGVMGAAMSAHLLKHGYGITLHARTKAKAVSLLAEGARWAETPKSLADQSDVIFTMVGFPQDVRDVYHGNAGLLTGARGGSFVVDMATTSPHLAQEIRDAAKARGATYSAVALRLVRNTRIL
jgi:3-hydroxyisobutyrate dehydrogenase